MDLDHALTTTRAVRKRLDLDRPVEPEVINECLELAIQAPTGGNGQGWRWVVVTDADKRTKLADWYRDSWNLVYGNAGEDAMAGQRPEIAEQQRRVYQSADYLANNLERVPVHVIPCILGALPEGTPTWMAASHLGSIIPAIWSFQLALRSRGLGSTYTTLHLAHQAEASEMLGIPDTVTQVALIPVAYTKGTDFKPRRPASRERDHLLGQLESHPVTVRVDAAAVCVVTIDRPEVHNCVDTETATLLEDAVRAFDADDAQRVLILTGAGGKSFCSGADLKNPPRFREAGPMGISRLEVGKPTIAAIEGYCFAGGLELACWCDFRICDDTSAFGVLNRRWGVPLIDGGTQRLPKIVGLGNALYLIESGVRIDAPAALRMGLVQEMVPAGTALQRCKELAARIAEYPQASLMADREGAIKLDGIDAEAKRGGDTVADPDMVEGLKRFASGDRPPPPDAV